MSPLYSMRIVLALAIFFGSVDVAGSQISLDELLTPYLARYDLPALAAAAVQDGNIIAAGAVGTRRVGTDIPVTLNDRFHLGSDTKAMTALLAAMLVEEGKLHWDSTLADVFPELAAAMNPGLRRVTLVQFSPTPVAFPPTTRPFSTCYKRTNSSPAIWMPCATGSSSSGASSPWFPNRGLNSLTPI